MSLTFPVLLSIVIRKDEHQLTKICNLFPITVFRGAHLNLLLSVCDLASIVLFGLAVYSLIDETLGQNSLWKKNVNENTMYWRCIYCIANSGLFMWHTELWRNTSMTIGVYI